jgi:hypothetical protein
MSTPILCIIAAALAYAAGIITVRQLDRRQRRREQAAALRSWQRYTDLRPL